MSGLRRCTLSVPTLVVIVDMEFRSVEGGAGQARTYCAPQSGACAGGAGVLSEQNFQASAHSLLRNRVSGNGGNPVGIFTFHFKTVWDDGPDVPATAVEYYAQGSNDPVGFIDAVQRRSLEPTYLISESFYSNATMGRVKRPLTEREVCHSISNSSRN